MVLKRTVKLVLQLYMSVYTYSFVISSADPTHVLPVWCRGILYETLIWGERTELFNQKDSVSLESVSSPWRQQHKRRCNSDCWTIHPTPSINTVISQKSPFSRRLISSHCSRETYRASFLPAVLRLLICQELPPLLESISSSCDRTTTVWCNATSADPRVCWGPKQELTARVGIMAT